MDTIRISWILPDKDKGGVAYFVNGAPVGSGGAGFDAVLDKLRRNALAAIVLQLGPLAGGGGRSLKSMLPFADRYAEFAEALGGRDAALETK